MSFGVEIYSTEKKGIGSMSIRRRRKAFSVKKEWLVKGEVEEEIYYIKDEVEYVNTCVFLLFLRSFIFFSLY